MTSRTKLPDPLASNAAIKPTVPLDPLFRPAQYDILTYQRGKLGVSAVPGSGKTFTLAHLAARLVRRVATRTESESARASDDPPEVLIVTFTNVSAESFKRRLTDILRQRRVMLPYIGYRVRTLHGLAHDIIQERPALVGLPEDFSIADERTTLTLVGDIVRRWCSDHVDDLITLYADPEERSRRPALRTEDFPDWLIDVGGTFIRAAKDRELDPPALRKLVDQAADKQPDHPGLIALVRFGVDTYESYQHALSQRNAIDFDDLGRLALRAIRTDSNFRKRLQKRWPYILEDEAQDSSQLQQELLALLSDGKNWVRVGDPNQAINTTFTTANPDFLRSFLDDPTVTTRPLDQAGRSALPIITLANALVDWVTHDHPVLELRDALRNQQIHPTPPGDLQGNPPTAESAVYLHYRARSAMTTDQELTFVVKSIAQWLPDHPNRTLAILVPDNKRGIRFVEQLRSYGLPYEELLSSTGETRQAARLLHHVLGYLSAPVSGRIAGLPRLYREVWWPLHLGTLADESPDVDDPPAAPIDPPPAPEKPKGKGKRKAKPAEITDPKKLFSLANDFFKANPNAETWLYPDSAQPTPKFYTDDRYNGTLPKLLTADLEAFRRQVRRWLEAIILPIDQLVLTINQDLFTSAIDLALGYKFAGLLRGAAVRFPDWRLPEFVDELDKISKNERKFIGLEADLNGYQPTPGRITVSTYHRAKGLEWDRVYLTGVSNYVFPSLQADDRYLDEKPFIRDHLNLKAESLAQLDSLRYDIPYTEGEASAEARIAYAAEHLRLLYVGITRARREVCLSWNTGRFGGNRPALPLTILAAQIAERAAPSLDESSAEPHPALIDAIDGRQADAPIDMPYRDDSSDPRPADSFIVEEDPHAAS